MGIRKSNPHEEILNSPNEVPENLLKIKFKNSSIFEMYPFKVEMPKFSINVNL